MWGRGFIVIGLYMVLFVKKVYQGIYQGFERDFTDIISHIAVTDDNLSVYSNQIHELHLRVCTEIENIGKHLCTQHLKQDIKYFYELYNSFIPNFNLNQKFIYSHFGIED